MALSHMDEEVNFIGITGNEFLHTNIDELDKKIHKNIEHKIKALSRKTIEELGEELNAVKKSKNMEKYRHLTMRFTPQSKLSVVIEYLKTYQKAIENEIKRRQTN